MEKLKSFTRENISLLIFVGLLTACGDLSYADVALADVIEFAEPPESAPWYVTTMRYVISQFPILNGWLAAAMIFMMSLLRGLAELLTFIASKTETKRDDEIAALFTKILRWLSAISAWFGLGAPKK